MRLDDRHIRFIRPFWPKIGQRLVPLGGRRGSVHLQETALVVEGDLLRFRFLLGIEWLFRQALSEWTSVTVPYARIERVRRSRLWPLRSVSLLLVVAVWVGSWLAARP